MVRTPIWWFISCRPGQYGLPDLSGVFVSAGYNLVGIASAGNGLSNSLHDLAGSNNHPLDPKLGPLANNGTNTPTFDLRAGSLAIDAGDSSLRNLPYNLTIDQRGVTRTFGASVDIGAVEYNGFNNGILQQPAIQPAFVSGRRHIPDSLCRTRGKIL